MQEQGTRLLEYFKILIEIDKKQEKKSMLEMMKESNKFVISNITISYAKITNLPRNYIHSSGTKISFDLIKYNEIEVNFNFQNSSFSKQEGFEFARSETYKIVYSIALHHKLHTECNPCHTTSWGDSTSSERSCSISGKAAITLPTNIQLKLSDNLEKYEVVLEFFNQALYYNEKSGKEKEVAFWIYFSLEALQTALYGKHAEYKLILELITFGSFDKKNLNAFKNSIGQYHRHYQSSYQGKTLTIKECLEIYKTILDYFVSK